MPSRPPVEKLPLVARKNLRDEFESQKEAHEAQLLSLLGEKWTINFNVYQIYAYAQDSDYPRVSPGDCLNSYVMSAVDGIKRFLVKYGDDGKNDLNAIASNHTLTLEADDSVYYCGCDIKDGNLRILFRSTDLGVNIHSAFQDLDKAVAAAPHPTAKMNLHARQSIKIYEEGIEALRKEISEILALPSLVLNPLFEENYAILSECKKIENDGWQERLGEIVLNYFSGWKDQLVSLGFKGDDMLQEGFQEGVPKGEAQFRVVKKLKNAEVSYHWSWIDDGVFVIEAKDEEFGVNVHNAGYNTLDLL